jgi:hypothetical protein
MATAAAPSRLPVAYFVFAHLCALTAFGLLVWQPGLLGGFFHPRLVGVTHLITLGWICASILGALHIVLPLALSVPFPATRLDRWCWYPSYVVGLAGMVSHFWIFEFSGMAWSGVMVVVVLAVYAMRVWRAVGRARIPGVIRWTLRLAWLNLGGAVTLGLYLAFARASGNVSGLVLQHVSAHAHLAAVGFVLMLVMGLAWRLLPMALPSRVPPPCVIGLSAALTEAGLVLLVLALVWQHGSSSIAAWLIAGGLATFIGSGIWMFRHRVRAPAARPSGDPVGRIIATALLSLAIAVALGLVLSRTEWPPPTALALGYGLTALVGGIGLLIVGMQIRLLPMDAWQRARAAAGVPPAWSAHARVDAGLARGTWICWLAGLLAIAAGVAAEWPPAIAAGAWLLSSACAFSLWHLRVLTRTRPAARSRQAVFYTKPI